MAEIKPISGNRCKTWNDAMYGVEQYLKSVGIKCKRYTARNIVSAFCREQGFSGSVSDKFLYASQNFNQFKQFIKTKTDDNRTV